MFTGPKGSELVCNRVAQTVDIGAEGDESEEGARIASLARPAMRHMLEHLLSASWLAVWQRTGCRYM